jgi:hypothetical protein
VSPKHPVRSLPGITNVASLKLREDSRMPRPPNPMAVSNQDEQILRRWTRSSLIRTGLAVRARIVLLAVESMSNTQIVQLHK